MIVRVVIDTNVLVSRFLSPTGTRATLINHWLKEKAFTVVVSEALLQEYQKALTDPSVQKRHRLPLTEIKRFIRLLCQRSILVSPKPHQAPALRDPGDNKLLECALSGKAKYLVSGDRDLLTLDTYKGIQILTPGAFLTILESTKQVA